jgi:hypothetical protein
VDTSVSGFGITIVSVIISLRGGISWSGEGLTFSERKVSVETLVTSAYDGSTLL